MISLMLGRQPGQGGAQHLVAVFLLQHHARVVRRVGDGGLDLSSSSASVRRRQRRDRLEAGDREEPGRHRGAAFEPAGLAPHVEEHVAHEVLGQRLVADEAQQPAVDRRAMARANSVCMASRSPSPMRATSMSSEEVSTGRGVRRQSGGGSRLGECGQTWKFPWSRPAPSTGRPKVGSKIILRAPAERF